MDQDKITALARKYAEERASIMQGSLTTKIQAELVIRFLLRRYCLVEKKDVVEIYQCANNDLEKSENQKHIGSTVEDKIHNEGVYAGKMEAIELLFPEIAKEVER